MITGQRNIGNLSVFLFAFLIFGFPIQSFIPFILSVDSTPINVSFRILFVVIAIIITGASFEKKSNNLINLGWFAFILFWIFYGSRLIYDLEIKNLLFLEKNKEYVYSFAFGVCLIPSIAIYYSAKYIDSTRLLILIFTIILISNLCITYAILTTGKWNITEIVLSRANVNVEINGETKSIINPITIGFFGEIITILSMHILNFNLISDKKYFRVGLYFCIGLGILNLVFGASRGPMVSLVILALIEFYFVAKKRSFNKTFIVKILFWITATVSVISYELLSKVNKEDIELLNRLSVTAEYRENDQKEERDYLYQSAWNQFLDSPIIGDSYLTKYPYPSYSHNLFLDVLMSTGIIGAILFGIIGYSISVSIKHNLNNAPNAGVTKLYILLYIGILLISMTSGGLFTSAELWIFSAFMLSLNNHANN